MSNGEEIVAWRECWATFENGELTIANVGILRRWAVRDGALWPTALISRVTGREWLVPADRPAPCPPVRPEGPPQSVDFDVWPGVHQRPAEPAMVVELAATWPVGTVRYRFTVYPGSAAITTQVIVDAALVPATPVEGEQAAASAAPTGVELDQSANERDAGSDLIENFRFAAMHCVVIAPQLSDQTDVHDNLVHERRWLLAGNEWTVQADGCVFAVEDSISGEGLLLLKHAPLPHARSIKVAADLVIDHPRPHLLPTHIAGGTLADRTVLCATLSLAGHGIGAGVGEGYPTALICYRGGKAGRIAALHQYQRQLRAFNPAVDGLMLSNTWGDRNRDARVCEAFISQEIAAGAKLGVDVVQIDDGWEQGVTANSAHAKQKGGVWDGFWAADANFWQPHKERFPAGLGKVAAEARKAGMALGLWFAPDSANDFANWERDAEQIIRLHRELGVCHVKIDGVRAESRIAEQRLRSFFDRVLAESVGLVTFDIDVTAQIRPGYFGLMNIGPVFVENRYTDWRGYWPHHTLRNIWQLSHWVDPIRLRMEWLNPTRNSSLYGNDPLAPSAYPPATIFATTMLTSPLAWMEVSCLPPEVAEAVRPVIAAWREHRPYLQRGLVTPIGDDPTGGSFCGFVIRCAGRVYALIFRQVTPHAESVLQAPLPGGFDAPWQVLAGDGQVRAQGQMLHVSLPQPLGFVLAMQATA